MTTKMYSYKRERAKRLYPEPAIFNKTELGQDVRDTTSVQEKPREKDEVPRGSSRFAEVIADV